MEHNHIKVKTKVNFSGRPPTFFDLAQAIPDDNYKSGHQSSDINLLIVPIYIKEVCSEWSFGSIFTQFFLISNEAKIVAVISWICHSCRRSTTSSVHFQY